MNRDTSVARRFHAGTKYVSVVDETGAERWAMGTPPDIGDIMWEKDFSIEPFPYKIYESLDPLPIPSEFTPITLPVLEAVARTGREPHGNVIPDRAALARIALLSNGILKRGTHMHTGRPIEYRAAGGTGARYHLELYVVCGDLPDLEAGIYHYAAHDHSFRRVRAGDYRAALVEATGNEPAIAAAPATLIVTSTFWRNAWRYAARAYRHAYWDAGTCLTNVLAVAAGLDLPTELVLGFADARVNAVLDVDGVREAALALCAIGRTAEPAPPAPAIDPLGLPTRPISAREVEFPLIGELHAASSLDNGDEAAAWRATPLRRTPPPASPRAITLRPLPADELPALSIEEALRGRRSTRHYDTEATISLPAFSTLLERSSRGFAADCLDLDAPPLHDQYLFVSGVEDVDPGLYRVLPGAAAIEPRKLGDVRWAARRLALEQGYAGDAHVNSYYLTDLGPVLDRLGNRGYRVAQLEAALFAGRLHLGTHALGLGAVGSTSFDDEVTRFISPGGAEPAYLFVVVFGKRRPRQA